MSPEHKEAAVADEDQTIAPFSELLLQQRGGALHAEASDALHELVEAIDTTGKGGELRIILKIKPIGQGRQVTVTDEVVVKAPQQERPLAIWFPDGGSLSRRDPNQAELPGMRPVPDANDNAEEATG